MAAANTWTPSTAEHDGLLNFLKQNGSVKPTTPRADKVLADIVAAGLAKKDGDTYVYLGKPEVGFAAWAAFGFIAAFAGIAITCILNFSTSNWREANHILLGVFGSLVITGVLRWIGWEDS